MSVKNKIMLANLITFLLVVTFMFLFLFFVLRIYTNNYLKPDIDDIYNKSDASISLSEIRVIIDDVHNELIQNNGKIEKSEHYSSIRKFLEKTNSTLTLFKNDKFYYISDSSKMQDVMNLISTYTSSNKEENFNAMYLNKDALIISSFVELNDNSEITVYLVNTDPHPEYKTNNIPELFSSYENSKSQRTLVLVALIGMLVVVLVSGGITLAVSRSIINPLKKLKQGTKNISEGNLDYDIEPDISDDGEIKDVIKSFNSMRLKLKTSDEQKTKYENSRKELIAGISHDLKTPITSIKGYVSGLMDGVADTREKQIKYLKTILSTAEDMDHLVDELFLFSKLDLDKIPFELEKTDIGAYLEDCSEEMKFAFENDKLAVSFSNRLEEPKSVMLDKNKFGRVLINVARNSVKYKTEEIGSLHIDVSMCDKNTVRIEMKDNGMGVESDALDKIFDSFYRTDKSRSNPGSGSGLGLSISKQIVLSHGGKIYGESIVGQGLAVIIELPVLEETNEKNTDSRRR